MRLVTVRPTTGITLAAALWILPIGSVLVRAQDVSPSPARGADSAGKAGVHRLSGVVVRKRDGKPVVGAAVAMADAKKGRIVVRNGKIEAFGPRKRVLWFFPRRNGRTVCQGYTDTQGRFTLRNFASTKRKYNIVVGMRDVGFALLTDVRPADYRDKPLRIEIDEPAQANLSAVDRVGYWRIVGLHAETQSVERSAGSLPGKPWPARVDLSYYNRARHVTLLPEYRYRVEVTEYCRQNRYHATLLARTIVPEAGKTLRIVPPEEGGTVLSGQVRDAAGKPLPYVNVMVDTPDGWTLGALADKEGRYSIAHVPPGKRRLHLVRYARRVAPG